jgi:plasmid stabilization system protein ParE
MTRGHEVRWARVLRDDLLDLIEFIAHENPADALNVLDRLERRAQSLIRMPARGLIVPELKRHGVTEFRELIEAPWRIVHLRRGAMVSVVAVLDGRRRLEDILLDRFLRQ